jgi:hypothetical protein
MVDIVAGSNFTRTDGSYVQKGQRISVTEAEADELKAMRLARDATRDDPKPVKQKA